MPIPPLILVPGLLCDSDVWQNQKLKLETLTTTTIADHGSLDSFEKMAQAILKRAPNRFAIAGHSMGGRVVLEVFRQAPDRIEGMALMDTAYAPRRAGQAGAQEAEQRHALLEIANTKGMRAMAAVWSEKMVHPDRLSDSNLMNAILDMVERKTPSIFAAQIKALLERPDATPLLEKIQCPTMVLCGRQDAWSVLSQHQEMATRIPRSNLAVIENCGHMSTMERPGKVTVAMREWLTSL